jgi:colanic acid/amylovoran biosynthesis glycosyltransferase
MRIAFLVRRFPALSETFVLNQITGLIDRGHQVDIFAETRGEALVHPDVARYELQNRTHYSPPLPSARAVRWLKGAALLAREAASRPRVVSVAANVAGYGRQALNMSLPYAAWPVLGRRNYDIIHCHFGPFGVRGMALREMGLIDGALVVSFHGYDLSQYLRTHGARAYSRLFSRGDLFLPVTDRWRRCLVDLGCPPARTMVHRMGIDLARFTFRPRTAPADGITRLVSVARFVEKKGLEYAIRAIAELKAAGRRVSYTMVGTGPLEADLSRLVASLGASDVVQFVGQRAQPEVMRILDGAHLVVVPSVVARDGDEEGLPVVLLEAMAMGLPVVATRHSGIPEVVEDGVSGVLVPERDVQELARAIGALADYPDRWPEVGHAGHARVLAQHDIHTLNDSLDALYRRIA